MDLVILHLDDLPSPTPFITKEPLSVMFHAQYDTGVKYVETNFPNVPVKITPRMGLNNHI